MIIKKRGLSAVIATVLLLILTIAAVAVIAGVIIPFTKGRLGSSTECVSYQDYFSFEEIFELSEQEYRYNCRTQDNGNYLHGISVRAKTDDSLSENVAGFDLRVISKEGSSEKLSFRESVIIENVRIINKTQEIATPKSGGVITYVYKTGTNSYDKYEIYPVLKNGRICSKSDNIDIVFCDVITKGTIAEAFDTT